MTTGADRGSLHALVGRLGEFTDGRGRVCQCKVTSVNAREKWLRITYWNREAGRAIKGAFIGIEDFRPDEPPNEKVSDAPDSAAPNRE